MWLTADGRINTAAIDPEANPGRAALAAHLRALPAEAVSELTSWIDDYADEVAEQIISRHKYDEAESAFVGVTVPVEILAFALKVPLYPPTLAESRLEQVDLRWRLDAAYALDDLVHETEPDS